MKMRRRTGVNGVRENHRDTVVNQGGTAESFGPFWRDERTRLFLFPQKIRWGKGPCE